MNKDKTVGLVAGDRLQMKKKHPCGSDCFLVLRVGADLKLRCLGCGRELFMERAVGNARIRKVLTLHGEQENAAVSPQER